MNVGAAMAGGNGKRRAGDFYPTPWAATEAMRRALSLPRAVWEPACGDGALARALERHGHILTCSDIEPRMDGAAKLDFVNQNVAVKRTGRFAIVTNPPFSLAESFIRRSLSITPQVVLLLKANYWNAASRLPLYAEHPPSRVMPLTFRIDVTGQGNPTMDVCWYAWGFEGPAFMPLPKPKEPHGSSDLSGDPRDSGDAGRHHRLRDTLRAGDSDLRLHENREEPDQAAQGHAERGDGDGRED